ncbi:MAG: hypothetical protein JXR37_22645 [Kiritimatiellae bacterium]|nr:hypothetical protein [Kiritimatiellia bacterium]
MARSGSFLRKIIHIAVDVCLVAAIIMILWSVGPTASPGSDQDAERLTQAFDTLEARIQDGQPFQTPIEEREINAYLALKVKRSQDAAAGQRLRVDIDSLTFSIRERDFVLLMVTEWLWGSAGKRISCEITGVPRVVAGELQIDITGARLGHLPLPGPGATWLADKVATIFSHSQRERDILRRLSLIELREKQATVGVN